MIYKNMVLRYLPVDDKEIVKTIRIIAVHDIFAYYVFIDDHVFMPQCMLLNKMEEAVNNGLLEKANDPYKRYVNEKEIKEKHIKIRNERVKIVSHILNNYEEKILSQKTRGKCLKEVSKLLEIPVTTIRKFLNLFWQRGMNPNALLPDFHRCGNKGQVKKATDKKRGRPRNLDMYGDEVEGINVDKNVEKIFEDTITEFYRDPSNLPLTEAYHLMLRKYFSDTVFIGNDVINKIWDVGRIPTYEQFYYWYRKKKNFVKDYISRNSETKYNLNKRPLLGSATTETLAPGSLFEIDATPADIYLVSSMNRNKIIGRPVVYAVVDVFSRLVVGIYVGLEGPSWLGAMMALDNVIADKVEFCASYNININHEEWPSCYLPEKILADRGEFEGYNVEGLINNLGVHVENTPPYRGDLKPIVERQFRTINEKIKRKTPGAIQKEFRERGDLDYRLNAKLDIKQFTKMIILLVLEHNLSINKNYPREKGLVCDEISRKPIDVWNWGIKNRKGKFVVVDPEFVRFNLLPKGEALINRHGIKFKGQYYACDEGIDEQWFTDTSRKVDIRYDVRNMDNIYIIPNKKGLSPIKCIFSKKAMLIRSNF